MLNTHICSYMQIPLECSLSSLESSCRAWDKSYYWFTKNYSLLVNKGPRKGNAMFSNAFSLRTGTSMSGLESRLWTRTRSRNHDGPGGAEVAAQSSAPLRLVYLHGGCLAGVAAWLLLVEDDWRSWPRNALVGRRPGELNMHPSNQIH